MTVVAACSVNGKYLPHMIIFQGQHVQSTWRPTIKHKELHTWLYCNKSGWMDSETFYKWYQKFEEKTRKFKEVSVKSCQGYGS